MNQLEVKEDTDTTCLQILYFLDTDTTCLQILYFTSLGLLKGKPASLCSQTSWHTVGYLRQIVWTEFSVIT